MFYFTFLAFDLQKFVEQSLLPVLLLLLLCFKILAACLEFRDQPVSLSCSVFRGKSNFLLLFLGPFLIFCTLGSLGDRGACQEGYRGRGERGEKGERGQRGKQKTKQEPAYGAPVQQ